MIYEIKCLTCEKEIEEIVQEKAGDDENKKTF